MTLTIRNVEPFTHFLTLNYGHTAPDDDRVVKKHLDRIKTWLVRRGVKLVWKLEFTESGRPHFHLLLVGEASREAIKAQWMKIVGASDRCRYLIDFGAIRNEERVHRYAMKRGDSPSNQVPNLYKNAGRLWGTAGGLKPEPLGTYEGTVAELAPIIRVLRRIAKRRLILNRARADGGLASMTLWATGGDSIAAGVQRYWALLYDETKSPVPRTGGAV
jgi:hypothetical protein